MRTPALAIIALLVSGTIALAATQQATAVPLEERTYAWYGQIVSVDGATKLATVKVRIPDYVEKYVDRFKPGEQVIVVWNMIGRKEAHEVLALWKPEGAESTSHTGFILPVEFVSADTATNTVTFKTRMPDAALGKLSSAPADQWIKATAPMVQPAKGATLSSVELTSAPPPPESKQPAEGKPADEKKPAPSKP